MTERTPLQGGAVSHAVSSARRIGPYWTVWSVLLVFTITMLWLDTVTLPRVVFVAFMLAAMLVKAGLIAGYFMHLRFERASLAWTIVVGLLATAVVLYVLIAPDAVRIHDMVNRAP
jgi:caa(3)-type oxidase subunit IV